MANVLKALNNKAVKVTAKKPKFLNRTNPLQLHGHMLSGYEPLPLVEAPYLPKLENPEVYTLVMDLDETLVHYYEVGGEGQYFT